MRETGCKYALQDLTGNQYPGRGLLPLSGVKGIGYIEDV